MYRIRDRLTYANVMVTLVALVVLGVAAYLVLAKDDGGGSSYVVGSTAMPDVEPSESWRVVGAANEPPFTKSSTQQGCRWGNRDRSQRSAAAFSRDSDGVVHLRGQLVTRGSCASGSQLPAIFILPPGYRPRTAVLAPSGRPGHPGFPITIASNGGVRPRNYFSRGGQTPASLNGISFRCGPSGQNGCL
jgi:hypothetical protein